jgi:hypothetical protein
MSGRGGRVLIEKSELERFLREGALQGHGKKKRAISNG